MEWFYPAGELAENGWQAVVDESLPDWQYTGLRVATLTGGRSAELDDADREDLIIPLAGSFQVSFDGGEKVLSGRGGVFSGPTDVLYLPAGTAAEIRGSGRVAVASAPTADRREIAYIPAADTPVELRGAGTSSRQIHNFGTPQALDAARLIVCEVITPSGNWSSYPPHKHDEYIPGVESRLEEIYYFEAAAASAVGRDDAAFGMFATYSSPGRDIDLNTMVRTGDIALVPHGYHGPAVAAPGYHLYYLNVMAGPDPERIWNITDDPAHGWVRSLWDGEVIDPRLPLA